MYNALYEVPTMEYAFTFRMFKHGYVQQHLINSAVVVVVSFLPIFFICFFFHFYMIMQATMEVIMTRIGKNREIPLG